MEGAKATAHYASTLYTLCSGLPAIVRGARCVLQCLRDGWGTMLQRVPLRCNMVFARARLHEAMTDDAKSAAVKQLQDALKDMEKWQLVGRREWDDAVS